MVRAPNISIKALIVVPTRLESNIVPQIAHLFSNTAVKFVLTSWLVIYVLNTPPSTHTSLRCLPTHVKQVRLPIPTVAMVRQRLCVGAMCVRMQLCWRVGLYVCRPRA